MPPSVLEHNGKNNEKWQGECYSNFMTDSDVTFLVACCKHMLEGGKKMDGYVKLCNAGMIRSELCSC